MEKKAKKNRIDAYNQRLFYNNYLIQNQQLFYIFRT